MVKLFMKECVWRLLCCQWTAYQFSSSLSHLCHLIFIPIKPPFHISFLSLSCLSLLLFPLFVFLTVCYSLYILLLISPCDFFSSSYSISVSSSVVLLPLACFYLPVQYILIPFCTNQAKKTAGSQLLHPSNYSCAHLFLPNLKILQNDSPFNCYRDLF